jgi:hypothetical protein
VTTDGTSPVDAVRGEKKRSCAAGLCFSSPRGLGSSICGSLQKRVGTRVNVEFLSFCITARVHVHRGRFPWIIAYIYMEGSKATKLVIQRFTE